MRIMVVFISLFATSFLWAVEISVDSGFYALNKMLSHVESDSTTLLRSEEKSVIEQSKLNSILDLFSKTSKSLKIDVSKRDKESKKGKNSTFTFYGNKLYFNNFGLKTSIKFRIRFYVLTNNNSRSFERSESFENSAFVELKLKNPSSALRGVSVKNRIKMSDILISELCAVDPKSKDFDKKFSLIQKKTLKDAVNPKDVVGFFDLLKFLLIQNPNFMKLQLAISYERVSLKIKENKYKKRHQIFKKNVGQVEYQVTMDKNIKSYQPKLYLSNNFSFTDYFKYYASSEETSKYYDDSVVVEVKTPAKVCILADRKKSVIHLHLQQMLFNRLLSLENIYPSYKQNKGKFYHLSRGLTQ